MAFSGGNPVETGAKDDINHRREVGVLLDDVDVLDRHRMSAFGPQSESNYTENDRWQAHKGGVVIEVLDFEP